MTESEGGVETTRISRRRQSSSERWERLAEQQRGSYRGLPAPAGLSRPRESAPEARVTSAGARYASVESASRAASPTGSSASAQPTRARRLHIASKTASTRAGQVPDKFDCPTGMSASSAASTSASRRAASWACGRRVRSASSSKSLSASAPGRATRARAARARTSAIKAVYRKGLPPGALLCSRSSV